MKQCSSCGGFCKGKNCQLENVASTGKPMQPEHQPMFWYRPRRDGFYEGPIHNASIERVRKESGGWHPLYTASLPWRQPLTRAQIIAKMPEPDSKGWIYTQEQIIQTVRALEADYNTKGEQL